MKIIAFIVFLSILSLNSLAQNNTTTVNISTTQNDNIRKAIDDSIKFLNSIIQHYSYSDTIYNSFAKYLINSDFNQFHQQIKSLKELPLNSPDNKNNKYVFRILSLPSFNHPICFTVSENHNNYCIHWKVGKGAGGYKPKGVKKKGKTKISKSDWDYFLSLINISDFDTLPLASYMPMCDGTSWVIEKNINHNYKIFFTNEPSDEIEDAFALLSHISKVKNKETIFFDDNTLRYFNKDNKKIDLDFLKKKVLTHLNNHLAEDITDSGFYFDDGIFIKINSKEKVKSVKYIPYTLPYKSLEDRFDGLAANFEDRKYRLKVKNSFKTLDLSELNLSKHIWVRINFKYNKETKLLELEKRN